MSILDDLDFKELTKKPLLSASEKQTRLVFEVMKMAIESNKLQEMQGKEQLYRTAFIELPENEPLETTIRQKLEQNGITINEELHDDKFRCTRIVRFPW